MNIPKSYGSYEELLTVSEIDDGSNLSGENIAMIEFAAKNKFSIQADLFSQAILENSEQAISLEDSFANMATIDSVFCSAKSGNWEKPEKFWNLA